MAEHGPDAPGAPTGEQDPILDAALSLFVERGVDGTPVPAIAERAGVGVGTVYRRFESKEVLVNRLFRHWKRAYLRKIYFGFPLDRPIREQFRFFWSRLAAFARAHTDAFLFLEAHHYAPHLDEESRALEQEGMQPVRRLLQSNPGSTFRAMNADALRAFLLGAFVGVVRAAKAGLLELTPELVDQLEECAWQAIAVPASAPG